MFMAFSVGEVRRRKSRRRDGTRLRVEQLEDRTLLTVTVTAYEQLVLDLVNRARLNPAAEAARLGIDLNQGLTPGTITTDPKQPLAPNQILIDVAGAHSREMLDRDYFSHNSYDGTTFDRRIQAAGYVGSRVGENIAETGSTGPIDQAATAQQLHDNLFLSTSGHRQIMLSPTYQEVGMGLRFGLFTEGGYTYNAGMLTEDFGTRSAGPFLTGVVYNDANGNQRYDIGEGLDGVTVWAGSTSTTTGSSGGWAIPVTNGRYHVTATGGSFAGSGGAWVDVSGSNVEVDFTSGFTGGYVNFQRVDNPVLDLGAVDYTALPSLDPSHGDVSYQLKTAHAGYLSLEAVGTSAATDQLVLLNSSGVQVATSTLVNGRPRIDYTVAAGETYYVTLHGTAGGIELRVANLLQKNGTAATVYGTAASDSFIFSAASGRIIIIRDVRYDFAASAVASLSFDGGAGSNSAVLYGTSGVDTATLTPGAGTFSGPGFTVSLANTANITVCSMGGDDTAELSGSTSTSAIDYFFAYSTAARMANSTYTNLVRNFPHVVAHGTPGSNDVAVFYDSAGADAFQAAPGAATMTGTGFDNRADGFPKVNAYATSSADTAMLTGSGGNDIYTGASTYGSLSTPGCLMTAYQFPTVNVSGGGGTDTARVYDTPGDDTFESHPTWASLSGGGRTHRVNNFPYVYALATSGGNDQALLYDDPNAADRFDAYPGFFSALTGTTYYDYAKLFESVRAFSSGTVADTANLRDSASAADTFESHVGWAMLSGGGYSNRADGFTTVVATATGNPAKDVARFYYSSLSDVFVASSVKSRITSGAITHVAFGFDAYEVQGLTTAGAEQDYLIDSTGGGDYLDVHDNQAMLNYANGRTVRLLDVSWVRADGRAGGTNTKHVAAHDFTLQTLGTWIDM